MLNPWKATSKVAGVDLAAKRRKSFNSLFQFMFMHIYKLTTDDKWHLYESGAQTVCGKLISNITLLEDRLIGQKGSEYFPDPDKKDVCKQCFDFIDFD